MQLEGIYIRKEKLDLHTRIEYKKINTKSILKDPKILSLKNVDAYVKIGDKKRFSVYILDLLFDLTKNKK